MTVEEVLFLRAKTFIDTYQFKPSAVEMEMTSDNLRFGGTLDAVGSFGRKFWTDDKKFWQGIGYPFYPSEEWLVDWKVANNWDDLHPIQGYGYSLLYKEKTGKELSFFTIVRISKDPNTVLPVECRGYFLPDYEEEWKACRLLYDLLNKEGKWECLRKRGRK